MEDNKYFIEPDLLYKYIEVKWGLRLSGAEKMLLKNSIGDNWDFPDNMLGISRFALDSFGFNSEQFRLYRKEIAKSQREHIDVYERHGGRR